MRPDGTATAPAGSMGAGSMGAGSMGAGSMGAGADPGRGAGPGPGGGPTDRSAANGAAAGWTVVYLRAREREGRLYPDAAVARLPDALPEDPLRGEWRQRADSAARLVGYLGRLPRPLVVLEVGCGNGWLANRIAGLAAGEVVGLDASEAEIGQARRVFGERPNLRFVVADVLTAAAPVQRPNVIVLASVIQYAPDLAALIRGMSAWLAPGGEIHILDSPLYGADELAAARERTNRHYAGLGVPEMASIYRHHDWRALDGFAAEVLYRPGTLRRRLERRLLGRARSPFPWIRIRPGPAR